MSTWIALLRGINVGGKNILPMKQLVRHLQALDLENVKTYIQSGNAVFQSSQTPSTTLAETIAARIEDHHGFKPRVLILSADALQIAIDANPFPEAESDPKTLHLFFLVSAASTPDLEALSKLQSPTERFELRDRVFYLHTPEGLGTSKLARKVEKLLGVATTARNWRTVQKLWSMVQTP